MKDDEELEMLLGEIPQATSSLHQYHSVNNASNRHMNLVDRGYGNASCVGALSIGEEQGNFNLNGVSGDNEFVKHSYGFPFSPASGFSLQSDGSSSSLLSSGGGSHSDIGSQSLPQFEELKPQLTSGNGIWMDLKKASERNLVEDFDLARNFNKMCIGDEQRDLVYPNGIHCYQSLNGAGQMSFENCGASCNYMKGSSDGRPCNLSVLREPFKIRETSTSMLTGMDNGPQMANLLGSQCLPGQSDRLVFQSDFDRNVLGHSFCRTNVLPNGNFPMGLVAPDALTSFDGNLAGGALFYPSQRRMNLVEARDSFASPNMVQLASMTPYNKEEHSCNYQTAVFNGRNRVPLQFRAPQGRLEALTREDNLIIPGEGIKYGIQKDAVPKVYNTNYTHERIVGKIKEKGLQIDGRLYNAAVQESCKSPKTSCPFILPSRCGSLAEARGYIHQIAKNQHGCRVLQKLFDEGTSLDVQIIFNEIIDHAVELMMNPFGNYLMQKLLEVCNEEQRMRVLLKVTEEPGELVRICLNTHGTRVVQKMIEKLKARNQISLVISALEPGFLTLIKDLNGNHVIQRCLQCFTYEDCKFIFAAATKHCVEIATHQHGCCVLQRCISHSRAEHRDKLVSEISENGFLLAQDAFGNYVVQFILELKIPFATSKLTSQFEGTYVHLSTQKFSSHVVERCLTVCNNEVRAKVIHELLCAPYFDQLLQDPHANYVVQTALRFSEGRLHTTLVEAVESYRAIARNSPYSKRIFSNKHLKR